MSDSAAILHDIVTELEDVEFFDRVAERLLPLVDDMTRSPRVKRILSGTPLGHRLHPMLTDVPIGCWSASSFLDVTAWRNSERSARRLTAIGILAALPTIATGLSDWRDTQRRSRRLGLVHMASNVAGLAFEVAAWNARRRGRHGQGAVLGMFGLAASSAAGFLGGHLVFAERAGVDVEVPVVDDNDWHAVCRLDELADRQPTVVAVGMARVVVVRAGAATYASAAPCTHQGGPLHEHPLRDGVLTCSWHGSQFCVTDGRVARGPATAALPTYETREHDGFVEVRNRRTD